MASVSPSQSNSSVNLPPGSTLARLWRRYDDLRDTASAAALENYAELHPSDALAWYSVALMRERSFDFDSVLSAYERAVATDPEFLQAWCNLARTHNALGDFSGADEALARALQLDAEAPVAHIARAVMWLSRGNFEQGWPEYEWRLRTGDYAKPQAGERRWDGVQIGGSITVYAEQGHGDIFQCLRYLSYLRSCFRRVKLVTGVTLHALIAQQNFDVELYAAGKPVPRSDYFVMMMSLPGILGGASVTAASAYLTIGQERVAAWRQKINHYPGLKVGLVWQGNAQHKEDHLRSMPESELTALADIPGVQFFSLQQRKAMSRGNVARSALAAVDLAHLERPGEGAFVDCAAMLRSLDLLICVDTAHGHLAAAMGVPTWLLLGANPDWRWLRSGETTPWYDSVRLFRMDKGQGWQGLLHRVRDALHKRVQATQVEQDSAVVLRSADTSLVHSRHGPMMFNSHDQIIGRSLREYGEFSESETHLLKQVLKPGDVVIDAGANVGTHTLAFAQSVGSAGRVHAFEPQRSIHQLLCGNVALNSLHQVRCHLAALGAHNGETSIARLDMGAAQNFGAPATGEGVDNVPLLTIDSLSLQSLKLIKIDVQGHELSLLEGAKQTLLRCMPVLYVENELEDRSAALIEFLWRHRYRLYWHLPLLYNPDNFRHNRRNVFAQMRSVNMLCLPAGSEVDASTLLPIWHATDRWQDATATLLRRDTLR